MRIKVLFVCIHNSARSQMAEAILENLASDKFEVESAGLEPGKLNSLAINAMADMGIDISRKQTKSVFDLLRSGNNYNYVITVCDESQSERCPIFPGRVLRMHWSFRDPSSLKGTWEEKLLETINIRNEIKLKIENFIETIKENIKS